MASYWKGRSSWGSRPASSGYSYSGLSNWGNWGSSSSTSNKRSSSQRTRRAGTQSFASGSYKTVCASFQRKIDSFKTLFNQTQGAARFQRPSPTVLNSLANWINKGAIVQTCSAAQLVRWARTTNKQLSNRNPSLAACKSVLWSKFGKSTIKAVCRAKDGQYLVATSPTWQGKPFTFPR